MARRRRAACLLLVILPITALGGLITGCRAGVEVTVQPDPRVFTLFAGLLAGGYGSDADASLSPTQQTVLEALENLPAAQRDLWEALLVDPGADSAAAEFALTDQVLAAGSPPDFGGAGPALQTCLESLWTTHAETLYADTLEAHTAMGAPPASTAQDTVKQVLAYVRIETSPFDSLQVIPNPLASQGFSRSWLDPETRTAYVVLGPDEGDLTLALARETFRLCLDENLFQDLEASGALESLKRVFQLSRTRPFSQDRCGTLVDFVRENLARACTLRAFLPSPEDTAAALVADWDNGFTLVQDFYVALGQDFESGTKSLADIVGELVSVARAGTVADLMDEQIPTELTPIPPTPEGYPPPPKGWSWTKGWFPTAQREGWYLVGRLPAAPRAPFTGNVYSSWSDLGVGIYLEAAGDQEVLITVVGLDPNTPPIEAGRSIDVEKGDLLPWVAGMDVRVSFCLIYFDEVMYWLLGGE